MGSTLAPVVGNLYSIHARNFNQEPVGPVFTQVLTRQTFRKSWITVTGWLAVKWFAVVVMPTWSRVFRWSTTHRAKVLYQFGFAQVSAAAVVLASDMATLCSSNFKAASKTLTVGFEAILDHQWVQILVDPGQCNRRRGESGGYWTAAQTRELPSR